MHPAREQLWHIDGEHLFTSEEDFRLSGEQGRIKMWFTLDARAGNEPSHFMMFEVLQ